MFPFERLLSQVSPKIWDWPWSI